MNGIHDMGGMDGFGGVEPELDEPVFHAHWEGRVMALTRTMGRRDVWNLDMFRGAREQQAPAYYLAASYYKSWAKSIETLMLRHGLITADEIAAGHALQPGKQLPTPAATIEEVPTLTKRASFARPPQAPALFSIGQPVRMKNIHPTTHTRLPRYARGRTGMVERVHGSHVYPDSSSLGHGDDPQWLYTVVFDGRELWGPEADPTMLVSIDAFEPYLEAL